MAKAIRKKDKKKLLSLIIAAILVILAAFFKDEIKTDKSIALEEGNLGVYFVDVGQGHCTVIQSGSEGVLIDSGEREYAETVINFLKKVGVEKLRYVIATHPHSDHIGSTGTVISKIKADEIYMPYIIDEYTPTNKTYMNLLISLDENNVKTHFLKKKTSFEFGSAKFSILPPVEQTDSMNDMSLITRIEFGDVSFMIAGDAGKNEMKDVLKANPDFDFSADFYLMAHHGSSTSTYNTFLNKVNFSQAVISCGKDNDYGHPHREALSYLNKYSIKYYRTDENGTVSVITDGKSCNVSAER